MSSARALLYLLVAPLLTAAALYSLADPASAEARPQPAVEPQAVALWRFDGTAARVLVIAGDGGSQDGIRDLRLFHTATPGLAVETEPAKDAPPGQAVWEVSVRAAADAPDRGFADFYVSGRGPPGDPGGPATWLPAGYARLTVGVQPPRDASPLADAELSIETDSATADEYAPAIAYLKIQNTSNHPLRFADIEVLAPPFLDIEPALRQAEIAPHATLIVPFELKLNDRPRIGEWLLLASVTVARGSGPLEQRGIGVVEQTVAVGVPGVSEVLKLLELPSVLLVPGALILATWSLLLGGGAQNQPGWLQWKTSSFWLVAITLSIGVFGALTLSDCPRSPGSRSKAFISRSAPGCWCRCCCAVRWTSPPRASWR